jgi:hypothetical protein
MMKKIVGELYSSSPEDAGLLGERFQASISHKTPPVVGVISLEGG